MGRINFTAIVVVLSLIGVVISLIVWRNWRGDDPDDHQPGEDHPGEDAKKIHTDRLDKGL